MNIIGKTIEKVTKIRKPEYDDPGWLKLNFTDGTHCIINAGIGSFTGFLEDEYPTFIESTNDTKGLRSVDNEQP